MIQDYILIIGAMKSGTTTLFDMLSRHSAIAPSRPKEPGFFAFEEHWAQGFDWYESLFDFDPRIHRYGLDGSTDYTKHPFCTGVAARLAASAPRRFKLIYILRHPLRRLESHARHVQNRRCEVGRSPSPRRDHSLDAGISPVSLEISRYARQLDQHRGAFEAGDLLILGLEALEADPPAVMRRVLAFLDLPAEAAALRPLVSNPGDGKRAWNWLSRKLRHGRAFSFLPAPRRRRLAELLSRRAVVEGRFRLTEAEEAALAPLLRSEVERLRRDYGFELGGFELERVEAGGGRR